MKAFRILSRNIRDSFKSVFRNFSLSLASITCITITLLVVSISVILSWNVNNIATLIEKDVTIVAFLDKDIEEVDIKLIQREIEKLENIDTIVFQSKEDTKNEMMDASEDFKNVMQDYTEDDNPLQDSFRIKVIDIELIGNTANQIKNLDGVDVVKYGEGMVEQLVRMFNVVRNICIFIVVTLIIVTAFLISNTIKITIYSRRKEIEIMRLVGASNLNIKIPFVFEGLFLGILGSIIPMLATIYGYTTIFERSGGILFSQIIQLVDPMPFVIWISLILLIIGMIVGMFGSLLAVRKHLKI